MYLSSIDGPGRTGHIHLPRWTALLVTLGLMACNTPPPREPPPNATEPAGPSLYLELASLTEEPISKALVRLSSGERQQATEQGTLLLDHLPVGPQALQVQAEGFSSTVLAFDMAQDVRAGARLKLLPLGAPRTFDASEEAELNMGGMDLTIPAGSLRDAQGNPIQGEVQVFLSALNLDGGELVAAPGLLEGIPSPGAEPVGLESLGMVSLVFQQDGRVIPFARDTRIRGNVPRGRPGSAGGRPGGPRHDALSATTRDWPRVPVWRLDPESGRWTPTGELGHVQESSTEPGTSHWEVTLNNPPAVFNLALPFWWRSSAALLDKPLQAPEPRWLETACLAVKVEDESGQPVAGRMVVAQGVGYTGLNRAVTDAGGRVRLEVMRNQLVDVDAGGQPTRVSSGSDAGPCTGPDAKPVAITLTVQARTCEPGAARDCAYGGPAGTLGRGTCRAARETCGVEGTAWSGTCEGEVLPTAEHCGTAQDDDCDGLTNEQCASVCQEGVTEPCYTGREGTQDVGVCRAGTRTCVAGGTAWSDCRGQVLPEAAEDCSRPGDEDCDGAACLCWPGETQRCGYTGPPSTEGVGACRASVKKCDAWGRSWSECSAEVTPLPEEDCTTPFDDDCDGEVNEVSVCICTPNTSQSCYGGPEGTENVGVCRAGTKTCNASGTAWGACTGDVQPQTESCASALDEDCDGQVNESPPCGWVVTTGMNSARADHATVVLSNGHVLVMGGAGASKELLNTAEVYDPAAKTWMAVGNMNAKRKNFAAVLLDGGTVLAVGGMGDNGRLASAEVYDPVNKNWTTVAPIGSMASARDWHTATLLKDGRVLVSGGFELNGTPLASAEVYDPVNRNWTPVPVSTMGAARAEHTATLLADGKVLVTGGRNTSNTRLDSAELYDPDNNTWTGTDSMKGGPRSVHTATLLDNGQVLVAGGYGVSGHPTTTEVYDPNAKTWTSVGSLNMIRDEHTAVRLSSGHVLISGGDDTSNSTATAEMYDPDARTWTSVAPMTAARSAHTMVLLGTGEVFVVGGRPTSSSGSLVTTEVYNPTLQTQARSWMSAGPMRVKRYLHTETLLSDGRVLVTGGNDGSNTLQSAEVYDPSTGRWSYTYSGMTSQREKHTATLLSDGKVLVVGGHNGSVSLDSAELYDPYSGEWTYTKNNLSTGRQAHTATLLPDGKVLVAGGHDGSATLDSAELYDPFSDEWSTTGNLLQARRWHSATLLPDGKVLVSGGQDGSASLQSAELYDPAPGSGTWSAATGALTHARDWHTATLLNNGKVLVSGGHDDGGGGFLQQSELYDPAPGPGTWSAATGALTEGRREHSATLLKDGRVLVVGGMGNGNSYLPSAELYDPAAPGTWSSANFLAEPVARHTATLLENGMVLITGGHNSNRVLDSVLLYTP